ncbi:uncharacterized protein [Watersipora subatra]|uniref:uncharacterized protein n=1 Tax=Watersipora subatra TaxID=2589382 RepID=UPI00355AE237
MSKRVLLHRFRSWLGVTLELSITHHHRSLATLHRALLHRVQCLQTYVVSCNSVRCLIDTSYFEKIKEPPRHWTEISSAQLISGIGTKDLQLFDTRTEKEVNETGLIPGATNIPLSKLAHALELPADNFQSEYGLRKPVGMDRNLIVYGCDHRNMAEAVSILHTAGLFFGRCYPGGWTEYQRIKEIDDLSTLQPWTDISYETLMSMIASKDIQLFDVRSLAEVERTGLMPLSTHIPRNRSSVSFSLVEVAEAFALPPSDFQRKYGVALPAKEDTNIVLHCLVGIRSLGALSLLWDAGFRSSRHFPGGWMEYSARTSC